MTTGWNMGSNSGCVKILQTHRAVWVRWFLNTLVIIFHGYRQTYITNITVVKVFPPSNPAEAAPITVKLLLVLIVIKTADLAEIIPKLCTTFLTGTLHPLNSFTGKTMYLHHLLPYKLMILFVVVAHSTGISLIAAWSDQCAFSFVVFTSVFLDFSHNNV